MTTEKQTTLATIGSRPHTVRVLQRSRENGITTIVLEWREFGARQRKVVATNDTKRETLATAKAQAKALHARLVAGPVAAAPASVQDTAVAVRVTVADVYNSHVALREENWAPNTRKLATEAYSAWAAFAGAETDVRTLTVGTLAQFRAELRRLGRVPANAVRIAQRVKGMFRSAVEAGLLEAHPIATARLKVKQTEAAVEVPEFTPADVEQLLAQIDPRKQTQWRPWAAMMLAAILGPRSDALLHQELANITTSTSPRTIRWPANTDKTRRTRTQVLPRAAVLVVRIIRVWHRRERYTGRWLFPSPQWKSKGDHKPWTYAALWRTLGKACTAAGVTRQPMQAMHAFRRHCANEVLRATGGDLTALSYWIGDKDLRVLQKSYIRNRVTDGPRIAALMNGPRTAPSSPVAAEPAVATTTSSREIE